MASTELCVSTKRRPCRIPSRKVNRFAKLGDDLLIEILIRSFPNPRSACRSKAVCKRWSSVISGPRFNRRFVSHRRSINQLQHPPLLLSSNDPQWINPSFLPMPSSGDRELRFVVLDSFQDLLLCGIYWLEKPDDDQVKRTYFVCNPFTKQWIALPLAPNRPVGHWGLVARLVCEPRNSYSLDLGGGGDDGQPAVYFEYRFRVACLYRFMSCTILDVFCSESGKWIEDDNALVLDGHLKDESKNVVSCNGELFWAYFDDDPRVVYPHGLAICAFDPFRLDIPPSRIDAPQLMKPWWDISISQHALHLSVFERKPMNGCSQIPSSVWRLEEDRKSFSLVCKGVLTTSPRSSSNDPLFGHRLP